MSGEAWRTPGTAVALRPVVAVMQLMLMEGCRPFARLVAEVFDEIDWTVTRDVGEAMHGGHDGYVLDLGLPGPDDGWAIAKALRAESCEVPVLILAADPSLDAVGRAQRLGVELSVKREWRSAIESFASRVERTLPVKVRRFAAHYGLTPRQREVLGYYADDWELAEIAERLEIAEQTVQTHLKAVLLVCRAGRLAALRRLVRSWR